MSDSLTLNWWRPESVATPVAPGRGAFRALVAFTAILIVAPQELFDPLQPFRLALVAALAAIGTHLMDRLSGRLGEAPLPREIYMVGALVAWAVLMVPISTWPGGSVELLTDLYFKSVAIFVLLALVVNTPARLRRMAWALAFCIVPIALTAIYNYAAGIYHPGAPGRIAGYSDTGLAGNPNDLALLLNLVLPFVVALALSTGRPIARVTAVVILLLAMTAVVVTFSRTGFLTLATIAAIWLWRLARRRHVRLAATIVVALALLLMLAPSGYMDRLATVGDIEADVTGSAQDRWRDIVVATQFVLAHPIFGAGPGMDILVLNELRGEFWQPVHNAYLNYAVDLGLPGLALFLLLLGSCLVAVLNAERRRPPERESDDLSKLIAASATSLVAFSVAAFFHPVAYNAFFFYFAGLALAVRQIVDDEVAAAPPQQRPAAEAA